MMARRLWTHDELVLALALYFQLPFGRLNHGTPEVKELGRILGRGENSAALRLVNFAACDPYILATGRHGMSSGANNGCFWHGHEGCKYFVMPKSRTDFWQAKIERNKARDKEEQRKLASMGWHCITVWECQLKPKVREQTLQSLEYTLNHIFLEDHKVKRYELPEEEVVMAAEPEIERT